jgi:hypothetical protein
LTGGAVDWGEPKEFVPCQFVPSPNHQESLSHFSQALLLRQSRPMH